MGKIRRCFQPSHGHACCSIAFRRPKMRGRRGRYYQLAVEDNQPTPCGDIKSDFGNAPAVEVKRYETKLLYTSSRALSAAAVHALPGSPVASAKNMGVFGYFALNLLRQVQDKLCLIRQHHDDRKWT
jgi:hypothetical protein